MTRRAAKFLAIIALIDGAFATLVALVPMYMVVALFFAGSALLLSMLIRNLIVDDPRSQQFTAIARKEAYVAVFITLVWVTYFAITK